MFKKNGRTTTLGIVQPPPVDKIEKDKKIKDEKDTKKENKASK